MKKQIKVEIAGTKNSIFFTVTAGDTAVSFVSDFLTDMRAWIADCAWSDETDELTDLQVIRGIHRHYAGGIAEFILNHT